MYIWPRFHGSVIKSLDANYVDPKEVSIVTPEVIEVVQAMSAGMKGAQGALLVAINTVIKELKRCGLIVHIY